MSTFNIRQLEDRARDVDPDLRYMALEDFQKHLEAAKTPQHRNATLMVPLLFQLLNDSASEVQHQAVKSFAPLVWHISDEDASAVIEELYEKVEKENNDSKFSTSVPTLALRGMLSDPTARFSSGLSKTIFDALQPQIFDPTEPMTIDKIEIFIDMVKALGAALVLPELLTTVKLLIEVAFREKGIVGKRAVIGVGACLAHVEGVSRDIFHRQQRFYDQAISDTVSEARKTSVSPYSTDVFYTLLQVILAQARAQKAVSEKTLNVAFQEILLGLKLELLSEETSSEDLDIDELLQTNIVRENAMLTLAGLVPCFSTDAFLQFYALKVLEIVDTFLSYDPLSYQDSDTDPSSDLESEPVFSEDEEIEQFENTGENDALASKLRVLALVVLKRLLLHIPSVMSLILNEGIPSRLVQGLGDRSEIVSAEVVASWVALLRVCGPELRTSRDSTSRAYSDVSIATESSDSTSYSIVATKYAPSIERRLFNTLLTAKNISRFSHTRVLMEALIVGFSQELSDAFLVHLTESLHEFKISLKTFPEIVKTYNVVLSTYEFNDLPPALVDYITQDLSESLLVPSTYHSVISEILLVCGVLYRKLPHTPKYTALLNARYFPAIAQNLAKKEYSSDIKQRFLECLAGLITHVDLTSENAQVVVHIFQETLHYEVAANFVIETMTKVCEMKPQLFSSPDLCQICLEKLTVHLSSSDSSLYLCSLSLLNVLFAKTSFSGHVETINALRSAVFDLMKASVDVNLIGKCFDVLGHLVEKVPADEAIVHSLFTAVINPKLADADDVSMQLLETLVTQISTYNVMGAERLFSVGMDALDLKHFISAKIMALICITCAITDKVNDVEQQLAAHMQDQANPAARARIVFVIHFLGCMAAADNASKKFTFKDFFEIPKRETSDHICLAAARAMGLSIVRNVDSHLPLLLSCYQEASAQNSAHRTLYLVALKQLLKERSWIDGTAALRGIWDSLFQAISAKSGQLSHKEVLELKLAGDVLSSIVEYDREGDYQTKILNIIEGLVSNARVEYLIYTVVVIMKELVGNSAGDFEVQIVERIMEYLAISNLELKLAIVSTLLTGIYNKSMAFAAILNPVILPAIYAELSAKDEFKKTIPMGPYKYVVDEGLEVRKLCYELISAIVNLNSSKMREVPYSVDEVKVFEVLLEKGLKDLENEIISLAVYNLMQIMRKNESVVSKAGNQQAMIGSLSKILNRKLHSKASTQETESHEDTLRSVIKLCEVLNECLAQNDVLSTEWIAFYEGLKASIM